MGKPTDKVGPEPSTENAAFVAAFAAATGMAIIAEALARRDMLTDSEIRQMHISLDPWERYCRTTGDPTAQQQLDWLRSRLPPASR